MLRAIVLAMLLIAPVAIAAERSPAVPAWLEKVMQERGIQGSASDLRVDRTVIANGVRTTFEVPLSDVRNPFEHQQVSAPATPDVLVGQLTEHIMIQFDCSGYGAQDLGNGLSAVQGASWDYGIHIALGPVAGGVAASTGGDPVSNAVVIVGEDTGMTLAAGQLNIQEDSISIFGFCLLLIGQMNGTGAWDFS